jgi:hypothetical protein
MAPTMYCIQIQGHLAPEWSEWFDGMIVQCQPDGTTTLSGPVRDQAALHGLLRKVRDLGMPLLSVIRVKPDQTDASDVRQRIEAKGGTEE